MTQPKAAGRKPPADQEVLVIGVGNPERGDDGAGIATIRRLRGRVGPAVRLLECPSNVLRVIDGWAGADVVVLIDAMSSGAAAGTVRRFDLTAGPLPAPAFHGGSTHGFGLPEAIELARSLDRLPRRLVVYGIEGARFGRERGLSAPVAAAVRDLATSLGRVRAMIMPVSRVHPRGSR